MKRYALVAVLACGGAGARSAERGHIGVVAVGDTTFVASHQRVEIERGGRVVGRVEAPGPGPTSWVAIASIPAPDHNGRWAVAVADGMLWRIRADGEREPLNARLGVDQRRVLAVDGAGSAFALGLADGVAVSQDGAHLLDFSGGAAPAVAVAHGRVAIARGAGIEVFELGAGTSSTYPLADASVLAFRDPEGTAPRLVVRAGDRVYVEDKGKLVHVKMPAAARELVVAGAHSWVVAGDELYVLETHSLTRTGITGVHEAFGAANGDLWVSASDGGELAYHPAIRADDPDWQAEIAPVFQRTCSKCHLPGGDADHDLSTPAAWHGDKAEIVHRVLEARTMPPNDAPQLTDAERAALTRWLQR